MDFLFWGSKVVWFFIWCFELGYCWFLFEYMVSNIFIVFFIGIEGEFGVNGFGNLFVIDVEECKILCGGRISVYIVEGVFLYV